MMEQDGLQSNNVVYEMQQELENEFTSPALGFTICTGQAREVIPTHAMLQNGDADEFGRTITLTETAPNTFTSTSIGLQ